MKNKYRYIIATAVVVIALGAIAAVLYRDYKEEHTPSTVHADLSEYYSVPEGELMVIRDGVMTDVNALRRDGQVYIYYDLATKLYNLHLFENDDGRLIRTTETAIEYYTFDSDIHAARGPGFEEETVKDPAPVFVTKNGKKYINASFLEPYGFTYEVFDAPDRIVITYDTSEYLCAMVKNSSAIRIRPDIKADIAVDVQPGQIVRLSEGGGSRENGFIGVFDDTGIRGYILQDDLESNMFYTKPVIKEAEDEGYSHLSRDEDIYLGWHLVYDANETGQLKKYLDESPEVNVVAPTWFFMAGTDGELKSYASEEYIQAAHEKGVQVWATLKNDNIDGVFVRAEDSHTALSTDEKRHKLIASLLDMQELYCFEGINIDLESLKTETGPYFVEFIRELSVYCGWRGIILSVDNYVPMNYNSYYNLPEQSFVVDYVIIMGYDEHYKGSEEAGSVSSLGWFTEAADNTVARVSHDRVIMAVPFYTRLWKETFSGNSVTVSVERNLTMDGMTEWVGSEKLSTRWLDKEGQYYAELTRDGAVYRLWLEDIRSLELKVKEAAKRRMAGVAAWKLGDEAEGTWAAIKKAFEEGR